MDHVGGVFRIKDIRRVLAVLKYLFPPALVVKLAKIINAIDALRRKLCASLIRQAHLQRESLKNAVV